MVDKQVVLSEPIGSAADRETRLTPSAAAGSAETARRIEWPVGSPLFDTQIQALAAGQNDTGVRGASDLRLRAAGTGDTIESGVVCETGTAVIAGTEYQVTETERAIDDGHPDYDRWDLVVYDADLGVTVYKGTPAPTPRPPAPGAEQATLGFVEVPATNSQVADDHVQNWRSLVLAPDANAPFPVEQFDASASDPIPDGEAGVLYETRLDAGETLAIYHAGLTVVGGQGVPAGLSLDFTILPGDGTIAIEDTVIDGDGATHARDRGTPLYAYENTSGGALTVGIYVNNGIGRPGSGAEQNVFATARGRTE